MPEPTFRYPSAEDISDEQAIVDTVTIALKGDEPGVPLPNRIKPRAISAMLENLPKVEGTQITVDQLTSALGKLGYKLFEEDGEEPFWEKN